LPISKQPGAKSPRRRWSAEHTSVEFPRRALDGFIVFGEREPTAAFARLFPIERVQQLGLAAHRDRNPAQRRRKTPAAHGIVEPEKNAGARFEIVVFDDREQAIPAFFEQSSCEAKAGDGAGEAVLLDQRFQQAHRQREVFRFTF
jgi:hypothetical protein